MVIVRCGNCGREVEWSDGKELGSMEIECSGSTVICACGSGIAEDGGTLREFQVPEGAQLVDVCD